MALVNPLALVVSRRAVWTGLVLCPVALYVLFSVLSLHHATGSLGDDAKEVEVSSELPRSVSRRLWSEEPERPVLFPHTIRYPVNLKLIGEILHTFNCSDQTQELRDQCCARHCQSVKKCAAWTRDTSSLQSQCKLLAKGPILLDLHAEWQVSHWKRSTKLQVSQVLPSRRSGVLEAVREELSRPCPVHSQNSPDQERIQKLDSSLLAWLKSAEKQPTSQHKVFWELGILVSTKMCYSPATKESEMSWRSVEVDQLAVGTKLLEHFDYVKENQKSFQHLLRPGCSVLPSGGPMTDCLASPTAMPTARSRSLNFSGAAVLHHRYDDAAKTLGDLLWLDFTLQSWDGSKKLQVVVHGSEEPLSPGLVPVVEALGRLWPPGAMETVRRAKPASGNAQSMRCFEALVQRVQLFLPHPWQYTHQQRVMGHCKRRERGMQRHIVVHLMDRPPRAFADRFWVKKRLREWSQNQGMRIDFLGPADPKSGCDLVELLSDAAIYVFMRGPAGMDLIWLPIGAVALEVGLGAEDTWSTMVTHDGFYTELATASGQLFTSFGRLLPMRGTTEKDAWWDSPSFVGADWDNDFFPLLDVLMADWLETKLPPRSMPWMI